MKLEKIPFDRNIVMYLPKKKRKTVEKSSKTHGSLFRRWSKSTTSHIIKTM